MHAYRTHTCGELRPADVGETARVSGWVHRKRDHGNLLFVDVRDHYGITQCVIETDGALFESVEATRPESVVTITGSVVRRTEDTTNECYLSPVWRERERYRTFGPANGCRIEVSPPPNPQLCALA